MNREEKITAIAKRLGDDTFLNPLLISFVVIESHIAQLEKVGLVEAPHELSAQGQNIFALCQEFDWNVEDEEIYHYCEYTMADNTPEERKKFFCVIKLSMLKE